MKYKLAQSPIEFVFCEIKSIFLVNKFLKEFGRDKRYKDICNCVKKKKKLMLFPYKFINKYRCSDIKIYRDGKTLYTLIDGKKMYLKMKFKILAKRYVKNILLEQDVNSTHRYCKDAFQVDKNDILFDVGSAEGYFTLKNIDKIKHVYLFECNPKWIKSLKKTFEPYQDKVTIISEKISNVDNLNFRKIDSICDEYHITKVDFVKMDIEGFEENALKGMKKMIQKNKNLKISVCCYHTVNQEERIRKILSKNFDILVNDSYMIYYYDYDISKQFLRHGVLRCTKK